MKNVSGSLVRARVPLGWVLGLAALWLARPTTVSYALGLLVAAAGEAGRVWAAGYLTKWKGLTRSGPYAWTRNPLYLGSLIVGIGFALATARWEVGVLLAVFLILVYAPVIQTEAARLAETYPEAYAEYAREVPLFLPRPPRFPKKDAANDESFTWRRVIENREHVTLLGWLATALVLWLRMGGVGAVG